MCLKWKFLNCIKTHEKLISLTDLHRTMLRQSTDDGYGFVELCCNAFASLVEICLPIESILQLFNEFSGFEFGDKLRADVVVHDEVACSELVEVVTFSKLVDVVAGVVRLVFVVVLFSRRGE